MGAKPKVFSLIPPRSCVFSDLTFTSSVDIAQILFMLPYFNLNEDILGSSEVEFDRRTSPFFPSMKIVEISFFLFLFFFSYFIRRMNEVDIDFKEMFVERLF